MKYNELTTTTPKNRQPVGRGISAGRGKTAGRGTKGQSHELVQRQAGLRWRPDSADAETA